MRTGGIMGRFTVWVAAAALLAGCGGESGKRSSGTSRPGPKKSAKERWSKTAQRKDVKKAPAKKQPAQAPAKKPADRPKKSKLVDAGVSVLPVNLPVTRGRKKADESFRVTAIYNVGSKQAKLYLDQSFMGIVGEGAVERCFTEMADFEDGYALELDCDGRLPWSIASRIMGRCLESGRTPFTLAAAPGGASGPKGMDAPAEPLAAGGTTWRVPEARSAVRFKTDPKKTVQLWMDWGTGRTAWAVGMGRTEACPIGEWPTKLKLAAALMPMPDSKLSDASLVLYATPESPWALLQHAVQCAAAVGIWKMRFVVEPAKKR